MAPEIKSIEIPDLDGYRQEMVGFGECWVRVLHGANSFVVAIPRRERDSALCALAMRSIFGDAEGFYDGNEDELFIVFPNGEENNSEDEVQKMMPKFEASMERI